MTDASAQSVCQGLDALKATTAKLGIDPFMTRAFVSLPVIPALRINSLGVIDVLNQQVLPL